MVGTFHIKEQGIRSGWFADLGNHYSLSSFIYKLFDNFFKAKSTSFTLPNIAPPILMQENAHFAG